MNFVERLGGMDRSLAKYISKAEEVGCILSRVISEVLGVKVDYRLGDEWSGPDRIWLISLDPEYWRRVEASSPTECSHSLCQIIYDVFPELYNARVRIDSYIHILPEDYERVRGALWKLRNSEG